MSITVLTNAEGSRTKIHRQLRLKMLNQGIAVRPADQQEMVRLQILFGRLFVCFDGHGDVAPGSADRLLKNLRRFFVGGNFVRGPIDNQRFLRLDQEGMDGVSASVVLRDTAL